MKPGSPGPSFWGKSLTLWKVYATTPLLTKMKAFANNVTIHVQYLEAASILSTLIIISGTIKVISPKTCSNVSEVDCSRCFVVDCLR